MLCLSSQPCWLESMLILRLVGFLVRGHWVSHLRSCRFLSVCVVTSSLLDIQSAFWGRLHYFRDLALNLNITSLLLRCVLLTRVVGQAFGLISLAICTSLTSPIVWGDTRRLVPLMLVHIDILCADLRFALSLTVLHIMVLLLTIQIRIAGLNLLFTSKFAFQILWSHDVGAHLLSWHEILQC